MAQGQFSKQEADATVEAVKEMFDAIPKSKRMGFVGHLNDIMLFIEAAKRSAPDEQETAKAERPANRESSDPN